MNKLLKNQVSVFSRVGADRLLIDVKNDLRWHLVEGSVEIDWKSVEDLLESLANVRREFDQLLIDGWTQSAPEVDIHGWKEFTPGADKFTVHLSKNGEFDCPPFFRGKIILDGVSTIETMDFNKCFPTNRDSKN